MECMFLSKISLFYFMGILNNGDANFSLTNACVTVVLVSASLRQVFPIPFTRLSSFSTKHPQCILHSTPTFEILPNYITALYNGCLRRGIFPTRWKRARVIPIVKPGKDTSDELSKFRPISLLNVGRKVLEKVLINRINYVEAVDDLWHWLMDKLMDGWRNTWLINQYLIVLLRQWMICDIGWWTN